MGTGTLFAALVESREAPFVLALWRFRFRVWSLGFKIRGVQNLRGSSLLGSRIVISPSSIKYPNLLPRIHDLAGGNPGAYKNHATLESKLEY